ncbi:FUSC family protein [Microbacteriaceae bacterium K1510]|nr:FUSC family protein [Microbacteriaceae bacterium K1510]
MDIRALVVHQRPQLYLAFRIVISAVAALALAQLLKQPLPLWAALTAVIVTQMSVGRSLKATIDYFIGTIGGAIYGGAIGIFVPHANEYSMLGAVALTVAPLAYIASLNPSFSAAPITGVLVLFIPSIAHIDPLASAVDRVIEVGVGGAVGLAVSLLIFPASAHRLFMAAAAQVLAQIAQALDESLDSASDGLDSDAHNRLQDSIAQAVAQLSVVGSEAEHERAARLSAGPGTGPMLRTITRLRYDLVMLGRAVKQPLPADIAKRLQQPLTDVRKALAAYLHGCRDSLLARRGPPSLDALHAALESYDVAVGTLRRDRLTVDLSGHAAEQFFALGFALEQMRGNLNDLHRCVAEWAGVQAGAPNAKP